MPIGDPSDGFIYPNLTLMIDSFFLAYQIGVYADFSNVIKFYLTYPIATSEKDKNTNNPISAARSPHVDLWRNCNL